MAGLNRVTIELRKDRNNENKEFFVVKVHLGIDFYTKRCKDLDSAMRSAGKACRQLGIRGYVGINGATIPVAA